MLVQTLLRATLWLSLGGWVGAWGFFAFVVSRLAFQVLPGNVAGDLAGALLARLHFGGALAAFAVAAVAAALGRRRWVVAFPIVLGIVCIVSELILSPEVAAVRPSSLGAASTAETAQRFKVLHALSLGLFMVVHVASVGLLIIHARLEARDTLTRDERGQATVLGGRT